MEDTGASLPTMAFVAFQAVFAVITVALISGAIADRAKWGTWMIFTVIWATDRLLPRRALGVRLLPVTTHPRRRLDRQQPEGDRLRRWHRGPHQRRRRRPRAGDRARPSPGLAPRPDASAQPDAGHARCRPAVVRLVRLQRRLRADRGQLGLGGLGQHLRRHRCRVPHLAHHRAHPRRARHVPRCRLRCRRRPGRHHPVVLLGEPGGRDPPRRHRRCAVRPGRRPEVQAERRRLARRGRRAPRRRPLGHHRRRLLRHRGGPGRRQRPVLRWRRRPALAPGRRARSRCSSTASCSP